MSALPTRRRRFIVVNELIPGATATQRIMIDVDRITMMSESIDGASIGVLSIEGKSALSFTTTTSFDDVIGLIKVTEEVAGS